MCLVFEFCLRPIDIYELNVQSSRSNQYLCAYLYLLSLIFPGLAACRSPRGPTSAFSDRLSAIRSPRCRLSGGFTLKSRPPIFNIERNELYLLTIHVMHCSVFFACPVHRLPKFIQLPQHWRFPVRVGHGSTRSGRGRRARLARLDHGYCSAVFAVEGLCRFFEFD